MNKSRAHKSMAFFLAGVFAVFNIGIPVVLASCPMGQMTASVKCSGCATPTSGEAISKFVDTSCCKTRIVAERNTTEFSRPDAQRDRDFISCSTVVDLPIESVVQLRNSLSLHFVTDLPPPKAGIPILISSLLI